MPKVAESQDKCYLFSCIISTRFRTLTSLQKPNQLATFTPHSAKGTAECTEVSTSNSLEWDGERDAGPEDTLLKVAHVSSFKYLWPTDGQETTVADFAAFFASRFAYLREA